MGYGFCGFNALLYDMRPLPPDPTAGPGIPLPCGLRPGMRLDTTGRPRGVSAVMRYRDAITGEYVSPEYATANPDTTVSEQVDDFRGRVAAILRSGHSAYVMVQDIKALFRVDPDSGEILDAGNLPR